MNITHFLSAPSRWRLPYEHLKDPRTQHWLLVEPLWQVIALLAVYLLLVRYLPRYMAARKPLQLQSLLVAYNAAMTVLNAYIFLELLVGAWQLKYNYLCEPYYVTHTSMGLKIAAAIWWFYFSKCLEFADTIFFILRKKTEQLSFLHVYHHATMFPLWWIAVKWVPTGSSFLPAMINAFVHIIMYSYYAMSALGARWQRYLWWKRHLTKLQLAQFTVTLLWSVHSIISGCKYPRWIFWLMTIYMISFLVLFARFYTRKYVRPAAAMLPSTTTPSTQQQQQRKTQ